MKYDAVPISRAVEIRRRTGEIDLLRKASMSNSADAVKNPTMTANMPLARPDPLARWERTFGSR